jgi:large subunit ribosomal protein L29
MKMSELREKDTGSLHTMERELTENLFAARLQKRSGQLENTAKILLTRRELAQVKTVLRARELGLEVIEAPAHDAEKKPAKAEHKTEHKAKSAPAAKHKAPAAKHKAKESKSKSKASKPAAKPAAKKAGKKPASKKK